ncbi:hypothetical protein D8S78_09830 [Natrialba swarupiae]|nr:hypothetical protein [Natrialba swarupiae]
MPVEGAFHVDAGITRRSGPSRLVSGNEPPHPSPRLVHPVRSRTVRVSTPIRTDAEMATRTEFSDRFVRFGCVRA